MQRLIAVRLQADLMKSELVVIARTDALNARLIDSNVDPIDHPNILGKVEVGSGASIDPLRDKLPS